MAGLYRICSTARAASSFSPSPRPFTTPKIGRWPSALNRTFSVTSPSIFNWRASAVYCGRGLSSTIIGVAEGGAFPVDAESAGLPLAIPLEKPAEATAPLPVPPGEPLVTPEPKVVPRIEPRAAPTPVAEPTESAKLPTAAIVAGRVALGFGVTPIGSPNPPAFTKGLATVLGATFFNAGTGIAGIAGASIFTVSGLGSSRVALAATITD